MAPQVRPDLAPLGVKCSSTKCTIGLHYFGPAFRKRSKYPIGVCRDCGADLVDWKLLYERQSGNIDYLIEMLKRECWRHEWWHRSVDLVAMNHARRLGRSAMISAARSVLEHAIGPQHHPLQGRQTKTRDSIVAYAQHATGTCCRKCLDYWHGIPQNRDVTSDELRYLTEVVMRYVDTRIPDLNQEPEYVPPIKWSAVQATTIAPEPDQPRR